jgi:hypothetical protein
MRHRRKVDAWAGPADDASVGYFSGEPVGRPTRLHNHFAAADPGDALAAAAGSDPVFAESRRPRGGGAHVLNALRPLLDRS